MTHHILRRRFLAGTASTAIGSLLFASGCKESATTPGPSGGGTDVDPDLGLEDAPRSDPPEAWGDLTGRLIYDGTAPEREKLVVDQDVECCGHFDIRDETLMVGEDGGLANVYIYLRRKSDWISPELEENVEPEVVLDNLDCIFQPHCMKIWASKQTYRIINSDPVAQNVAFAPRFDTQANIVIPVDEERTWNFRCGQNEPVPIACNYHPWESAYILPLEHPYVAITDSDGRFTIPLLPVGRHDFQVWHERTEGLEASDWTKGRFTIEISEGENDLGEIRLAPELFETS